MKHNGAPLGRPKNFDADEALHQAMLVFWRLGYLGASLDDLTAAMGIKRPSIYGTFGDKEQLFLACIDRYMSIYGRHPREALTAPEIADALSRFFEAVVRNAAGGKNTPRGCLVACVLVGAAVEAAPLRTKLQDCVAATDAMIEARLARAVAEGQLPVGTDVATTARLTNSLRHGLALRARAGEAAPTLFDAARAAAAMVVGSLRGPGVGQPRGAKPTRKASVRPRATSRTILRRSVRAPK